MAFDLQLEEQRDRRGGDAVSASLWPLYRPNPCLLHADNNGGEEEGGRRPGAFQAILQSSLSSIHPFKRICGSSCGTWFHQCSSNVICLDTSDAEWSQRNRDMTSILPLDKTSAVVITPWFKAQLDFHESARGNHHRM